MSLGLSIGYGSRPAVKNVVIDHQVPDPLLSFLTCSSFRASSSRRRLRSALSAQQKLLPRVLHLSDSQAVIPGRFRHGDLALEKTDLQGHPPFFWAVHRSIGFADSDAILTSLVHSGPCRRGGLNFKGSGYSRITLLRGHKLGTRRFPSSAGSAGE